MHIGFCSPDWPPSRSANGIVTYVSAVREYLLSKGHRVSILSKGNWIDSDNRETPIAGRPDFRRRVDRYLDRYRGHLPGIGLAIADQVRTVHQEEPFDVLEMEESFGWSRLVQRAIDVPVITRLHGPWFLTPKTPRTARETRTHRQRCRAEERAVKHAGALTAPTRTMMTTACSHLGRPADSRNLVIPNPIRMTAAGKQWRLDACDRNHILMVGRFDHRKGADTLLLAFDQMLKRHPSARLTLVGSDIGIAERPGRLTRFHDFIGTALSPDARSRVTFTGQLPPGEIEALRRNAFVSVVASRYETFCYTLVEGMALGCPVVSTTWAGSEEILGTQQARFSPPIDDSTAMAERLSWMMANPERAAQMGAEGHSRCKTHFSLDAVGGQLLDLYASCAEQMKA